PAHFDAPAILPAGVHPRCGGDRSYQSRRAVRDGDAAAWYRPEGTVGVARAGAGGDERRRCAGVRDQGYVQVRSVRLPGRPYGARGVRAVATRDTVGGPHECQAGRYSLVYLVADERWLGGCPL